MECLRDFVGIEGCGAATPVSGEYVNSLPGITSFMVGKIADKEQVTYLEVWNDVQERAMKKFASAVISIFKNKKQLKIKTVSQTVDLGRIIDDSTPTAAAAEYRGFTVELTFDSNLTNLQSSLQVIYVQSVAIYSDWAGDTTLKIVDLDTEAVLHSQAISLTVGWNTVSISEAFDAYRIFVGFDATEVGSPLLNIQPYVSIGCQTCAGNIYGADCTATVYGAVSADTSDLTTLDKGSNTYGVSGVFSIQCRYDWLVCSNIDLFTLAWQYCLGAELMVERIYSDRINRFTGIDLEKAKELRTEFETGWKTELEIAIDGIDISENDCCVECVSQIQKPYIVP
jgi:hypothetical protein